MQTVTTNSHKALIVKIWTCNNAHYEIFHCVGLAKWLACLPLMR